MLRALAFEAVGEQQHEAALLAPLVLGGDDELVDDRLRAVGEVAELRLPAHERVAVGDRVAVLEAERRELREHGVVDHERRGVGAEVRERRVLRFGLVVDEHRVALAERAPPRVLAGEADRRALEEQRAERERLRERPVDVVVVELLAPVADDALELRVHREAGRDRHERVDDLLEPFACDAGLDAASTAVDGADSVRSDVARLRRVRHARLLERGVEPGAEVFERLLGVFEREVAAVHEQLGVELADRAALADHLVHARLRERGLVALVVAVAPVADHVDDDVLLERLAERERELHHAHARFGVVAVHVEDRRLHRLGDVGRVHGRAREAGRRGEADLVVHDDVHGAADVVAGQLREVQRLRDHALAGERGVAVDQHRQHRVVCRRRRSDPAWPASCLRRPGRRLRGGSGSRPA